jgi:hypothetical protein
MWAVCNASPPPHLTGENVDGNPLVRPFELCHQQPHLVTVRRGGVVVEPQAVGAIGSRLHACATRGGPGSFRPAPNPHARPNQRHPLTPSARPTRSTRAQRVGRGERADPRVGVPFPTPANLRLPAPTRRSTKHRRVWPTPGHGSDMHPFFDPARLLALTARAAATSAAAPSIGTGGTLRESNTVVPSYRYGALKPAPTGSKKPARDLSQPFARWVGMTRLAWSSSRKVQQRAA